MRVPNRWIDVELTNRCNATCNFCPREKTPKQGFMSEAVYLKTLERIEELADAARVTFTGLGEPMLHPKFVEWVEMALARGMPVDITTNGSRLTPEKTARLLDAGLKLITFSISDINEDYRKVYGLKFEEVLPNIQEFIRQSRGRCHVKVSIVKHEGNADQIEMLTEYWQQQGADEVNVYVEDNRGGSHGKDYPFLHERKYLRRSIEALREKNGTELCGVIFLSAFIGWNGQYYLCCNDWEKTVPLGHVDDFPIEAVDGEKVIFNRKQSGICKVCNRNPVNEVQDVLLGLDEGTRGKFALANKLKSLRLGHRLEEWLPRYQTEFNAAAVIASSDD